MTCLWWRVRKTPTSHKICCIGLAVDVDDLGYYSFVMRINVLYRWFAAAYHIILQSQLVILWMHSLIMVAIYSLSSIPHVLETRILEYDTKTWEHFWTYVGARTFASAIYQGAPNKYDEHWTKDRCPWLLRETSPWNYRRRSCYNGEAQVATGVVLGFTLILAVMRMYIIISRCQWPLIDDGLFVVATRPLVAGTALQLLTLPYT